MDNGFYSVSNIVNASSLDAGRVERDARDVCESGRKLCLSYEKAGGLTFPRRESKLLRELDMEGVNWLKRAKGVLLHAPLSVVRRLTHYYEILHRLCYGESPKAFLSEVRLMALKRWLKGDKSLNSTGAAMIIGDQMDSDYTALSPELLSYYFELEGEWIRELQTKGGFHPSVSPQDATNRMRRLLKDDLYAYLGKSQDTVKKLWLKTYNLSTSEGEGI